MNVLSLFSGIGGLDLGLQRAGMTIAGQVEIDPWCRTILEKHWPEVPRHDDVRTAAAWWLGLVGNTPSSGQRREHGIRATGPATQQAGLCAEGTASHGRSAVDVVCGGFPCQPVSVAGRQLAQADSRWLWPAFARIIRDLAPRYVLVENVPGLLGHGMGDVLGDLAALGYDTEWDSVPAAFVGAPHIRNRVFVVAYPGSTRRREDARGASGDESPHAGWPAEHDHVADGDGESDRAGDVADAEGQRSELRQTAGQRPRRPPGSRPQLADTDSPPRHPTRPPSQTVFRPGTLQRPGRCGCSERHTWPAEPDVRGMAHGLPGRLDGGLNASQRMDTEPSGTDDGSLRELWERIAAEPASQRQGSDKQLAGELADALRAVSHPLALGTRQKALAAAFRIVRGLRQACEAAGTVRDASDPLAAIWQSLPGETQDWVFLGATRGPWHAEWPGVPRVATGVPRRVDRLRGLGNAVVPQVAEHIGRLIMEAAAA